MAQFVLTAQLQLQAPNNVAQVVNQIQSQLNGVSVNVQVQGTAQANRQVQQLSRNLNTATSAASNLGRTFALSFRRFAAFAVATRAVSLFTNTLSKAVEEAIDFERQLVKISQVTGKSLSDLRDLTNEITRLSTGFGVSSKELLNVTQILAQAGLSAQDTKVALDALAKSALAPNFDSIAETAEGAIAVLAQFKQGVGALEAQLGSINAVAGAFAVEASDLIDVIRRTGGVFKASGGDLNELIALFTSVRATTRESAESIGTGLRTIFTRIQRPKTIEFLKQFGVELVDLEGKFVGPFEAVRRLSEALSGLGEGDITFIRIAEELGGFRQIGKVLPLLTEFRLAQEALNVAQKGGTGLAQDAATAQQALAIRIIKVKEEFLALVRSITETSSFQLFANTALNLASALIKLADSLKPIIPLLAAVAAIKIARGFGDFVGGFMGGMRSRRAFNSGGRVMRFARGGFVPGSGNRDTVPAMLQPGEFVIRKSSVKKLGAGNLAAMNENRFAYGGQARKFGIASLSPMDKPIDETKAIIPISNIRNFLSKKAGSKNLIKRGNLETVDNTIRGILGLKGQQSVKTSAIAETVSRQDVASKIEKRVELSIQKLIDNAATVLGKSLTINVERKADNAIVKSVGSASTVGSVFEGALSMLGAPMNTSKSEQDPIDFPNGLGPNLASAFQSLVGIPVDAKKTATKKILQDTASRKAASYLANAVYSDPRWQMMTSRSSVGAKKWADLQSGESIDYKSLGYSSYAEARSAMPTGFEAVNRSGKKVFLRKALGGLIQKFASGGVGKNTKANNIVQKGQQAGGIGIFDSDKIPGGTNVKKALLAQIKASKKPYQVISGPAGSGKTTFAAARFGGNFILSPADLVKYSRFVILSGAGKTKTGDFSDDVKSLLSGASSITLLAPDKERLMKQRQSRVESASAGNLQDERSVGALQGTLRAPTDTNEELFRQYPNVNVLREYAAGGGAGTDTVPALLTPGEFVINRSSAQKIGYGNLNRMNKVGKYASGGVVQRFSDGSRVDRGQSRLWSTDFSYLDDYDHEQGRPRNYQARTTASQAVVAADKARAAAAHEAALADRHEAESSERAAISDNKESASSERAAISDNKESAASDSAAINGRGGGGTGRGGDLSFGLYAAIGALSAFTPTVDKNSTQMDYFKKNLMETANQLLILYSILQGFGVLEKISGLLAGSMSAQVAANNAATASETAETAANNAAVAAEAREAIANSTAAAVEGVESAASLTSAAADGAEAVASSLIAGPIIALIIAITAAIAIFYSWNKAVAEAAKAAKESAIERGDVKEAGAKAVAENEANKMNDFILLTLGLVGAEFFIYARLLRSSNDYFRTQAEAQAQATKTTEALNKASEDVSKTMAELDKGTLSVSEALNSLATVSQEVANLTAANRRANTTAAGEMSTGMGAIFRDIVTLGGIIEESSTARNARLQKEIKDREEGTKKAQQDLLKVSQPVLRRGMEQQIRGGGTFETYLQSLPEDLRAVIMANDDIMEEQRKSYENLTKEIERNRKAAEAMNLGLRAPAATAGAMSAEMERLAAQMSGDTIPAISALNLLASAASEAGAVISQNSINSALQDVTYLLNNLGASKRSIDQFTNVAQSFATAQKEFDNVAQEIKGLGKGLAPDTLKNEFAERIAKRLPEGMGQKIEDIIKGITLTEDQIQRLTEGDLSVFQDVLTEKGKEFLEPLIKIAEEYQQAQKVLIDLTKKEIDAKRSYVEAIRDAQDLMIEGREIQAKYGGAAVSMEDRRFSILTKANARNNLTGLGALRTGSAVEINARSREIAARFEANQRRIDRGEGAGTARGEQLKAQQEDLKSAQKEQIQTIRELIKLEEENLKLIGEKNKLEKDSIDALISGDIDKFFETQAVQGAKASIASGNVALQQAFGASALGAAAQDIKRQQEAGVQTLFGQQLGGQGGLTERAFGAALGARGINDIGLARTAAGTTAEEEMAKMRLRQLGGALGEAGQLGEELAQMEVSQATINVQKAEVVLQDMERRGRELSERQQAAGLARGGVVYANNGIFVPRGTDTVPAMLTPGEFVVRREAVQRGNNLQILRAMNNGSISSGSMNMSRGGSVNQTQYLAMGGFAQAINNLTGGDFLKKLTDSFNSFVGQMNEAVGNLNNTSIKHKIDTTNVNHNFNGLSNLREDIKKEILGEVGRKLGSMKVGDDGKLKDSPGVV